MNWWPRRLALPSGLGILLTTIVALPAATLVWLGLSLLQQDRELERQRRVEILQGASERAMVALDRELSQLRVGLADSRWPAPASPAGTVEVVLTPDGLRVEPPNSIAYWPSQPALDDVATEPFLDADAAEFERHD